MANSGFTGVGIHFDAVLEVMDDGARSRKGEKSGTLNESVARCFDIIVAILVPRRDVTDSLNTEVESVELSSHSVILF